MGRKGGGRKGFMKSMKKAAPQPEEADSESVAPVCEETNDGKTTTAVPNSSDPQPAEAAAPLPTAESKSQLRDRHKKEQQALKKKCAQMGKKKKDEAAQLMQELKERQEQELAEFVAPGDSDDGETGGAEGSGNAEPPPASAGAPMSLYSNNAGKSSKLGKSQKRREKAAQKEADRDARIAKEHADMGESERCIEERTLNAKLESLGLKVYDIKADGHCLYRAVNHQLRETSANDNSYEELRKLAADYMRKHKEDFQPFFARDAEENLEESFEDHCARVESTAEWGGELELRALSHALERAIVVHSVDLPDTTLGEHNLSNKDPLRLCFMRHAYRLGNHYNSVEPVESSN